MKSNLANDKVSLSEVALGFVREPASHEGV